MIRSREEPRNAATGKRNNKKAVTTETPVASVKTGAAAIVAAI